MLRSDQKIPSDNSSLCTTTPAQRPSPIASFFNANAPTFSNYLPPFRSQTDPLPEPPQPWNRTENMATTNTANTVAERAYGVLRGRAKVAKGIQTDEGTVANRKRCWRHRRGSSDKSRRNSGSENEQSRQEANSNVPSPNGTAMSVLRSALLPNVSFPRWTRTNKAPRDNVPSEEGSVFSSLVESYLVPLYASSVRRQLTWQAEARCRDSNREHFEAHCLGPTARMLRTVREYVLGTCVFVVVEHLHTDVTQKTSVSLPYHSHYIALEVSGGATFVTGFAGYWGALYQENDVLVVFKFIVFISSIIELPVGAIMLAFTGEAVKQDTMTFVNSSVNEEEDFIFSIQRQMECCGSKSPADWVGSTWWEKERANESRRVMPFSCCKNDDRRRRMCQEGPPPYKQVHRPELIFTEGCHAKVVKRRRHLLLSSGSIFCFCGVGKLASFFAIHYFTTIIIAKQRNLDELRSRDRSSVTSHEIETAERNCEMRLKVLKEE